MREGVFMTVYVNENGIECGLCNSICLEVFTMTDEGVATAAETLIMHNLTDTQKTNRVGYSANG